MVGWWLGVIVTWLRFERLTCGAVGVDLNPQKSSKATKALEATQHSQNFTKQQETPHTPKNIPENTPRPKNFHSTHRK